MLCHIQYQLIGSTLNDLMNFHHREKFLHLRSSHVLIQHFLSFLYSCESMRSLHTLHTFHMILANKHVVAIFVSPPSDSLQYKQNAETQKKRRTQIYNNIARKKQLDRMAFYFSTGCCFYPVAVVFCT